MKAIGEKEARAMLRLVAEVAALRTDHAAARRYLMNGLKSMIGADCWVWTLGYLHPDRAPVYASPQHDGFDDERFARYLQAIEHPGMQSLTAPFAEELMTRQCHITRLRQQIEAAGGHHFPSSEAYPLWLAADIEPLILSAQPLNDECVSLIGIYRRADQPLFTERENRIAHILLSEVPWLHATGWPQDFGAQTPALSRRSRVVLNLLLEGHSRKFIAAELGISIHTVSGYIKEIYAIFGVHSHAELMRRFTVGDQLDRSLEAS